MHCIALVRADPKKLRDPLYPSKLHNLDLGICFLAGMGCVSSTESAVDGQNKARLFV